MRYIYLLTLLIIGVCVLVSGCTQPPAAPVTPAPASPTPVPAPTTVDPEPKQINVTAWKTEKNVVIQYNGGRDADLLYMLNVQIDNRDGKIVKTPIYYPEIGKQYEFSYVGIVNPNTINIIGVFKDGTEQTVLLKYF